MGNYVSLQGKEDDTSNRMRNSNGVNKIGQIDSSDGEYATIYSKNTSPKSHCEIPATARQTHSAPQPSNDQEAEQPAQHSYAVQAASVPLFPVNRVRNIQIPNPTVQD